MVEYEGAPGRRLRALEPGRHIVGVSGIGRFRLQIDGEVLFDLDHARPASADPVAGLMAAPQQGHVLDLAQGQEVDLVLLHEPTATAAYGDSLMVAFQLNVERPYAGDNAEIERAAGLAAAADIAVVVGSTEEVERRLSRWRRSSPNVCGRPLGSGSAFRGQCVPATAATARNV